jgi:hypothetical protein
VTHVPAIITERPATVLAPERVPRRAASERERLATFAVIAVPCAIAAALAFYEITARSLWLDEAASVAIASQHGVALWHSMEHDGGNMLAYYAFLHAVLRLFGDSALVIRFASAAATAGTAALVSLLAARLFGRREALAAGLLTGVSLTLVYWGQDARSYALMVTFITASFLSFVALVDREPQLPASRWVWFAYVATTVLAAYMSFEALLIVAAQLLSLVWHRRPGRAVISAMAVAVVCSLPLLVLAQRRGSGQLFWVPKPDLPQFHQMFEALLSAGLQPNFHLTGTATPLLLFSGVLTILAAVAIVAPLAGARRDRSGPILAQLVEGERERQASWPHMLVLCWLVVPVILAVLESYLVQPITLPRAALISLPATSLLLAWVTVGHRAPRVLGWCTIAVLLALRALQLAPTYGASPENWRAASAHVLAAARRGDCIAFYPADGRQAFSYYIGTGTPAAARAPRSVLPAVPWSLTKPFVEDYASPSSAGLSRIESGCARLWFVSSHRGQKHGPVASRSDYERYAALLGSLTRAYAHHRTVSYGWASPVRLELFSR